MLEGLFASIYGDAIPLSSFLAASAVSLKTAGTGGTMSGALALLPFLVQVVILLVNGNLGAGVAWRGRSVWCASAPHPVPPGTSPPSFWP